MLIFTRLIHSASRGLELHYDDMDKLHPPWPLPPVVSGQRPVSRVPTAAAGQRQTERRHLEKYAAAELPPTPRRPSLFVRLPDNEGGAGRGWQLADHVTTNVS